MAKGIAFFGGTFDPVHHGHLIVARAVAEHCGLERVTFVPAASPPHKQPARASVEHRLAMLKLAIAAEGMFDICELELHNTGPNYTYETLKALRVERGSQMSLNWIIGSDMLADLPKWHHAAEVVDMARILIAARPHYQHRMEQTFEALTEHFTREQIGRLRRSVVPTPLIDISSTLVRDRVAKGLSVRFLVPEPVRQYIDQQRIYGGDKQ